MSRNGSTKKRKDFHSSGSEENTSVLGNLPRSSRSKPDYFEPVDAVSIKLRKLVKPRTPGQDSFFRSIRSKIPISMSHGPAGSGKTYLSCGAALLALQEGTAQRIVITRPAVESDENIGFLPGGIDSKMMPYMLPIIDCFVELVGGKTTDLLFKKGVVQVRPFAFMRGSTFRESFIIADEMQNSTVEQFKCLLTRIGEGSKMVVSGDLTQLDLSVENGLNDFIRRYRKVVALGRTPENFTFDELDSRDIVRSEAVKEVLEIYASS